MTLTKERRIHMVRAWLGANHTSLKPGEAVVMMPDGSIGPLAQEKLQQVLADNPETFGDMAKRAAIKPGEGGVAANAIFTLVMAGNDSWSGWATPDEVGGVQDNTATDDDPAELGAT